MSGRISPKPALAALDPDCLRQTLDKVDKCVRRLQELHLAASSVRITSTNYEGSSQELPTITEPWFEMSKPAMLLREALGEITLASRSMRKFVESTSLYSAKKSKSIPRTPPSAKQTENQNQQRYAEKPVSLQKLRFSDFDKENFRYKANQVSPRNRPWAKKAVLFPNPLFDASPMKTSQKIVGKKSSMISKNAQRMFRLNGSDQSAKMKSKKVTLVSAVKIR
ncbi:probable microtubule-binding protein TANGLED [Andrographis paniculata]|uniref:probable microtubule-binding protein TANGLED n=1 Tax=Andrographis paniculata TaxID=175694 RepID=UPI0021E6FADF|nr:probable microtubule-binding protein TANGLED [Andrographis paniculata]